MISKLEASYGLPAPIRKNGDDGFAVLSKDEVIIGYYGEADIGIS